MLFDLAGKLGRIQKAEIIENWKAEKDHMAELNGQKAGAVKSFETSL